MVLQITGSVTAEASTVQINKENIMNCLKITKNYMQRNISINLASVQVKEPKVSKYGEHNFLWSHRCDSKSQKNTPRSQIQFKGFNMCLKQDML